MGGAEASHGTTCTDGGCQVPGGMRPRGTCAVGMACASAATIALRVALPASRCPQIVLYKGHEKERAKEKERQEQDKRQQQEQERETRAAEQRAQEQGHGKAKEREQPAAAAAVAAPATKRRRKVQE